MAVSIGPVEQFKSADLHGLEGHQQLPLDAPACRQQP